MRRVHPPKRTITPPYTCKHSAQPSRVSPVRRTDRYAGTPTIGNARSLLFPFHSPGAMEAGWCGVERRPPVPGRSELQAHDATVLQSLAAEVREGLGRSPGCYSGSSGAVALCNGRRVGSGARTGAACAKRRGLSMAGGRRAAELPRACRLPGRKRRGPRSAPDAKRDGADRRRTGKAGRDRRGAATAASISSNFAPVLSDCLLALARIFVPSTSFTSPSPISVVTLCVKSRSRTSTLVTPKSTSPW